MEELDQLQNNIETLLTTCIKRKQYLMSVLQPKFKANNRKQLGNKYRQKVY